MDRILRSFASVAWPVVALCAALSACGDGPSSPSDGAPAPSAAPASAATPPTLSPATGSTSMPAGATLLGQTVDLRADDEDLPSLLRNFSARTGIRFHHIEATQGNRLTLTLQGATHEQALARLLARFDTIVYRQGAQDGSARPVAVWIYARGAGAHVAPERSASAAAAAGLTAAAPQERAQAYEQLMLDRQAAVPSTLSAGLADTDATVRRRVLSQAGVTGIKLPSDVLVGMAQSDSDESVREAALAALATHPDVQGVQAQAIASKAVQDASPLVQSKAREILDSLQMRRAGGLAQLDPVAGSASVEADQAGIPADPPQ